LAKIIEAFKAIFPCCLFVLVLCLVAAPVAVGVLLNFLIGMLLLILGIALFSLGAEISLIPIGNKMASALTKTKKMPLILMLSLFLGFAITIAEPDLQVLASTVHFSSNLFVIIVGLGVGIFLMLAMARIFYGFSYRLLLWIFYGLVAILAFFVPNSLLGIAFDASGVTTGPMTVPFLLAYGVGVFNIRNDAKAKQDSFGLVSLCSIGPIVAVMILSLFMNEAPLYENLEIVDYQDTLMLGKAYLAYLPSEFMKMAYALLPIFILFVLFQFIFKLVSRHDFLKIIIGLFYTYLGLVFFLTAASVGFSQMGYVLGVALAERNDFFIIAVALLLGYLVISAEPAVKILEKQIAEISSGSIPNKIIHIALCIAISLALGLAAIRVIYQIPLLYIIIPIYLLSLILSFWVPEIYTAIAFDSGGVASGPLSATFLLNFILGLQSVYAGELVDAFGVVALIASMPLLSIQIVGYLFTYKQQKSVMGYGKEEIIELWEGL